MFRITLSIALLALLANGAAAQRFTDSGLRAELKECPEKSGGIYYAYPASADEFEPAPEGFHPFMIIHYGRHGSRWAINEKQYSYADSVFSANQSNLTPLGISVAEKISRIGNHARGHAGELSPLGEKQHKAIASRMIDRFPTLFADSMTVTALSSLEPRCIQSMAAFCERLKEVNSSLSIQRRVSPLHMNNLIAGSSPEAASLGRYTSPWQQKFLQFRDSVIFPERFMASLFLNPDEVSNHKFIMRTIHDIAIDLQDVDLDECLFDIFTDDEIFNFWLIKNYDMYSRHAYAGVNHGIGPESARPLLSHLIEVADSAISTSQPTVTLHFGHDTNLIRLLALMGIDGCSESEGNPVHYHLAWQDYKVSPMGANLQLAFFQNAEGEVIVLPRHNERIASFPLPHYKGTSYYPWAVLRKHLVSRLGQAE